jgi:putative transposase
LHWLGEALKREEAQLHACALMTNHVLLMPRQAQSVPRIVIALGRHYVQYINTACRRSGTLWDRWRR